MTAMTTEQALKQALNRALKRAAGGAALMALAACGGGGTATDLVVTPTPTATTLNASQLQGRWVTGSGVSPARTALVVPSASGSASMVAWVLSADFKGAARLSVSTSGSNQVSGQGSRYTPGVQGSAQAASYSGVADVQANTLSLGGDLPTLNRVDRLDGATSAAAAAGNWSSSANDGAVKIQWAVDSTGRMSATSSTGCSYSGALASLAGTVYEASLSETCPNSSGGSSTLNFKGVGSLRVAQASAPAALTLLVLSTADNGATALAFGLQPQ